MSNKRNILLTAGAFAGFAGLAWTVVGEPNEAGKLNSFVQLVADEGPRAISSSEVDHNFQVLAAEIQGLQAQLTSAKSLVQDLQVQVDTLESSGISAAPDCPPGYARDDEATLITLCRRGDDEMVKVGPFWIDRYEGAIVDGAYWNGGTCDGGEASVQFGGAGVDDYPADFPDNGNWTSAIYACSVPNALPSGRMTWFQAQQACHLSGKRLCTNAEWQAAVAGTQDPGSYDGGNGPSCNTESTKPRATGLAGVVPAASQACISTWGAEDMIGNMREWTDGWHQAGAITSAVAGAGQDTLDRTPWPKGYAEGQDITNHLNGRAYRAGGAYVEGMPSVMARGGDYLAGENAGAFAVALNNGPSQLSSNIGSRCCRD